MMMINTSRADNEDKSEPASFWCGQVKGSERDWRNAIWITREPGRNVVSMSSVRLR